MENKLSVCIIAKDDGEYLAACVRHIRSIADEVILLDMGVQGQAAKNARREGARVFSAAWQNDFSKIKNLGMEKASGRWVLFLHADERIRNENLEMLLPLLDNPNAEGYLFFIDYRSEGLAVSSPLQGLRLLRNRKENRFAYRSFETLPIGGMENICTSHMDIVRQRDARTSWEMVSRRHILAEEAEQNPGDGYLQYMSGIMLLNDGQIEACAACFEKARQTLHPGWLFAPHLYKTLGFACLYLERLDDAMRALDEGIRRYPFYTDLLVLRSELLKELGRSEEAAGELKKCLRIRMQPMRAVPGPEIAQTEVLLALAALYEQAFDYAQAFAWVCEAARCGANEAQVYEKIGVLSGRAAAGGVLDEMAQAALNAREPEKMMLWLHAFYSAREYQKAADYAEKIKAVAGPPEAWEINRNESLLMLYIQRGEPMANPLLSLPAAIR